LPDSNFPRANASPTFPPFLVTCRKKKRTRLYDPVIGRNFDIKNLWMRADLRVRPEMRNNACFGGAQAWPAGACNSFGGANARGAAPTGGNKGNDMFVQQWMRLGIGYDLSPDVNFYVEIIDSATWGGNGSAVNAGNGGDPLNHNGSIAANAGGSGNGGRLGVRAAYMLIRNVADIQGLSLKVGRQYVDVRQPFAVRPLRLGQHWLFT
jgi:hypothetical protein